MPELSRFYGIIIAIYFDEHNPPHFHARYNEFNASISIQSFAIIEGSLPPKALGLVTEWAAIHQKELMVDWELASQGMPLHKIAPL
jgi:hypothetical protein